MGPLSELDAGPFSCCQFLKPEAHDAKADESPLAREVRDALQWQPHGPALPAEAGMKGMTAWQKAGFSPDVMKAVNQLATYGYTGDLMAAARTLAGMEFEATVTRLQHAADRLAQVGHPAKRRPRR